MTKKLPDEEAAKRLKELSYPNLINSAKKNYKQGHNVEAFVLLYSALESELLSTWTHFIESVSKMGGSQRFSKDVPKERKYKELVQLLYETGLIDEDEKSIFEEFHVGRNHIVHQRYHFMKSFDVDDDIPKQFEAGLRSSYILWLVYKKIVFHYAFPDRKIKEDSLDWMETFYQKIADVNSVEFE